MNTYNNDNEFHEGDLVQAWSLHPRYPDSYCGGAKGRFRGWKPCNLICYWAGICSSGHQMIIIDDEHNEYCGGKRNNFEWRKMGTRTVM